MSLRVQKVKEEVVLTKLFVSSTMMILDFFITKKTGEDTIPNEAKRRQRETTRRLSKGALNLD